MNIILYGIGQGREYVEKVLRQEHKIVGYMDSYSHIKTYNGIPFYKLSDVQKIQYDYIVISIVDRDAAWSVMSRMITEFGVESGRVIPYSCYASNEIYKFKMNTCNTDIDGLILGNSHARWGYIENFFDGNFVNLSGSSQDLTYSNKIFKICLKKYKQKLQNLKYLIIDMYDYNYFNINTYLAGGLFDYIEWGGVKPDSLTINHVSVFYSELFEKKKIVMDLPNTIKKHMEELFGDCSSISAKDMANEAFNRWKCISPQEPLETDKFIGKIVQNRYEKTLNENQKIFYELINEAKTNFPGCKIIITLIPRYITMEKVSTPFLKDWKLEFEQIMGKIKEELKIEYFNLKNYECISGNSYFYHDICHLNTTGGQALTSILNQYLKRL